MDHKNLDVWKKSIDLVTEVYKITNTFPKNEMYGITSQVRRSAVSVPSNISEGAGRDSTKEYVRFLNISIGSLSELETQMIIAQRLKYIKDSTIFDEIIKVRKLLIGLKKYLVTKI
ncbi:four helix bundle protein [Lutibacter agarilyticus]|uniref:Four helix bundle protein n=1 Tax=Lutibacter agarilyticus TaxID=1109740 RepID=A0A238YYP7_9FLAO|nr:four helix bundle protein [Lutibacter agarilyticus]SNR76245.1 four helix bundle protein [Lutibacter agarilyticus]